MYINNMACYRLGTMLHLDIQNWKEAKKAETFQHQIGGPSPCTKILMMFKNGATK